jgi:hypothetical protein
MFYTFKLAKRLILSAAVCALVACDGDSALPQSDKRAINTIAQTVKASPYKPTATFQEIMDSVVDPSSDFIWDSVTTISNSTGIHEKQPHTDADWHEIRRRATVLVEAANLIAVPGRRVALGGKTIETADPLNVTEIQQRIDANYDQLVGFAGALREISLQLVAAADQKNVTAITQLGGTLDAVCESCHRVFWYPEDVKSAERK